MVKHRIGENSPYDGDMELIESFVKCAENPNDLMLADELTSYYVSRALYYWRMLKEYLNSEEILKGSNLGNEYAFDILIYNVFLERVRRRVHIHKDKFLALFDENMTEKKIYQKLRHDIRSGYRAYKTTPLYEFIFGENVPIDDVHTSYEALFDQMFPLPEDYITKTEKKMKRRATFEELGYNSMFYNAMRLKSILNNFEHYENEFSEMLEEIQNTRGPFNNRAFVELFAYIGNLNCLFLDNKCPNDYKKYENLEVNKIFLIVNGNGAFSLNTWMFAFFEGIDLLGFTSKRSEYDGNDGCSLDMFEHDVGHIQDAIKFKKYGKTFQSYKKIYYDIINSSITRERKELFVFVLWAVIHEFMDKIRLDGDVITQINTFMDFTYEDAGASAVYSEFRKFSDLLLTEENIQNTLENKKMVHISNKNMVDLYTEEFKDFEDHLLPENRHLLTDIEYTLLGLNYVFNGLKDNRFLDA